MRFNRRKVSVAVVQALSIGMAAGLAAPAFAQLPPTQEAQAGQTFRLEVTGTRIKVPGLTSASPISSYSAEEMTYQQPAAVEEFMRTLPANQASIGPGTNNGSGGGATIDLRGLGSNRSLVLIDGRRVTPFDLFGAVNTDVIPLALLARTDIVTGGATSVYGPDAIAGVVNFILKKDFKGFDVTSNWGQSEHGDGTRTRTDVTWGAGFDGGKGNVAMSFGYTKTQAVLQGNRKISECARSSTSGNCSGSGTTVPVFEGGDVFAEGAMYNPATQQWDIGAFKSYNFNPLNLFQTPLDRTQAVAVGDYLINNHFDVYGQFMFTRSQVTANLAPSGSFLDSYMVPLGNPYLSPTARQQVCDAYGLSAADCANPNYEVSMALGRRFTELGPRLNDFQNNFYQWTVGTKGDLLWNWTYDAYYSEGRSDQTQTRGNWGSYSKLSQALRATNPTTCLDTSNNCVPLNIFGPEGSITPAMLGFINLSAVLGQSVQQRVGSFSAQGDLGKTFKSPWSKEPIGAAFGYDNRTVYAANRSDGPSQTQGEVLGTGAPTPDRSGKYNIKEIYGEVQVPIITGWDWVRRLSFEGGYRHSRFETTTSDEYDTWKLGGEWEPIQGFRLRAMKNRATRAPNINELFAPLVTGLSNLATDPCQGNLINTGDVGRPGTLSNLCAQTGVPLNRIGVLAAPSAGQINNLGGGNPSLGPEVSDTVTIGVVWQPTWARGLTVTGDYYNIEINQAISSPSVTDVLQGCYSTTLNPSLTFNNFCALIGRNPTNGTFNGTAARGVWTPTSNIGYIKTSGWDLFVDYNSLFRDLKLDPKYGRLDINFAGTWVTTYEFKLAPTAILRDCVGYYSIACNAVQSNGGPIFKQKFNQRTTWYVGDFLFTYNWIYLGSVDVEPGSGNWYAPYRSIPSYSYFNFAAEFNAGKNVKLQLSVNNVFDKDPPAVGNTIGGTASNSGNTFPQSYDTIGRFITVGVEVKF